MCFNSNYYSKLVTVNESVSSGWILRFSRSKLNKDVKVYLSTYTIIVQNISAHILKRATIYIYDIHATFDIWLSVVVLLKRERTKVFDNYIIFIMHVDFMHKEVFFIRTIVLEHELNLVEMYLYILEMTTEERQN